MIEYLLGISPALQLTIAKLAIVAVCAMMFHAYIARGRPFISVFFGCVAIQEGWWFTFWMLYYNKSMAHAKQLETWAPSILPTVLFIGIICLLTDFFQQRSSTDKVASLFNGIISACLVWTIAIGATVLFRNHGSQFANLLNLAKASITPN